MNHAMPVAKAASELLLLKVHDLQQLRDARFGIVVVEQQALVLDPDLGEQGPSDAIDLRQRQRASHEYREHAPEAALQCLGVDALRHFIRAHHPVFFNGPMQFSRLELLARDVGQHHAVAPGEGKHALPLALGVDELGVALERIDDVMRMLAGLFRRIADCLGNTFGQDFPRPLAGLANRVQMPILDFEDQQSAAWVKHDEVGVRALGADGHVIPEQIVVIELLLKPFGKTLFATRHARHATAQSRNEGGQTLIRPEKVVSKRLL